MSLKKEPSGRRSIQVEVEVPGTPEEVWQAIATGPGISAWFVPTEVREDGTVVSNFGPGMESVARITAWDAPRKFAAESADLGPGAPPVATEWIVEARGGGVCVVRVVHSLFASTDEWDDQLQSFESGWPWFFSILRLYLTHFSGQACSAFRAVGFAPPPKADAWEALTRPLGLAEAAVGDQRQAPDGLPTLAGRVEQVGPPESPQALLLRLDQPAPGILSAFGHEMGGQVCMVLDFYLYGDPAAAAVQRDEPRWQSWFQERFPMPGEPPGCG